MKTLQQHISQVKTLHSLNEFIEEKLIINKSYIKPVFDIKDYYNNNYFIELHTIQSYNKKVIQFFVKAIYKDNLILMNKNENLYQIKGTILAGKTINNKRDGSYFRPFYFDEKTGLFYWKFQDDDTYRILFPANFIDDHLLDKLRNYNEITFEDIDKIFNIHLKDLISNKYRNDKISLKFKVITTKNDIENIKNAIK